MTPIKNMDVYNAGMRKSMLDKIWWIDKINDDVDSVMDYGCADGTLLSMIHDMNPSLALFGYDFNSDMIDLASENVEAGCFATDFNILNRLVSEKNKCVLIASSVFHEIENYSDIVEEEYSRIFNTGYKYIAIRDMFISEKSYKLSDQLTVAKVRQQFSYEKIREFERFIGSLDYNENLLQFFLTYRYKENWDREVREDYFPHTIERFLHKVPDHYQVVYFEHYALPFVREQVWKDFGIQITEPTHAKILLKLKDNLDD
jgi:ribosomal protein L11 methylase PrmA